MVLFTKGLAQINQASAMVDPSSDRFADVANLLKQAGGVFMALTQVMTTDKQTSNLVEIDQDEIVCLSDLSGLSSPLEGDS